MWKFPPLPRDFTVLHNDPAASQDHCGRCRIRTRYFYPRSLARYQMSHHISLLSLHQWHVNTGNGACAQPCSEYRLIYYLALSWFLKQINPSPTSSSTSPFNGQNMASVIHICYWRLRFPRFPKLIIRILIQDDPRKKFLFPFSPQYSSFPSKKIYLCLNLI